MNRFWWRILIPIASVFLASVPLWIYLEKIGADERWGYKIVVVVVSFILSFMEFALPRVRRRTLADAVDVYRKLLERVSRKEHHNEPFLATTALLAFITHRTYQRHLATAVLFLTLTLYVAASLYLNFEASLIVMGVLAGCSAFLQVGNVALEYRIRHALYGTNEYEARQIINFVLSNAEEIDLSSGLGSVEVSMDSATEEIIHANWGVVG